MFKNVYFADHFFMILKNLIGHDNFFLWVLRWHWFEHRFAAHSYVNNFFHLINISQYLLCIRHCSNYFDVVVNKTSEESPKIIKVNKKQTSSIKRSLKKKTKTEWIERKWYDVGLRLGWDWAELPIIWGFPGHSEGKESTCNAGDLVSIPGLGISSREGNGNPL